MYVHCLRSASIRGHLDRGLADLPVEALPGLLHDEMRSAGLPRFRTIAVEAPATAPPTTTTS
jgi:hypothetical protein